MDRFADMGRRAFLKAAVGSVMGAGAAQAVPVAPAILEDAVDIGRAVLRTGVVESDAAALRAALGVFDRDIATLFTPHWNARMRRDFATGDTVHVAGWTLSRSEARLCALAASLRQQGLC